MGDTNKAKVVCSESNAFVEAASTDGDGVVNCPGCGRVVLTAEVPGFPRQRTIEAHTPKVDASYLATVDVAVAEHFPHADGQGVRALEAHVWQLLCSLAGVDRVPTIREVERLAGWADVRRAPLSDESLFALFAKAAG